jgi:WD40 repeat protein
MWKFAKTRARQFPDADTTLLKTVCNEEGTYVGIVSEKEGCTCKAVYSASRCGIGMSGLQLERVFEYQNSSRSVMPPIVKVVSDVNGSKTLVVMNCRTQGSKYCDAWQFVKKKAGGATGGRVLFNVPRYSSCFDVVYVGRDPLEILVAYVQKNEIRIYPSGTVHRTEKSDCLTLHFTKDCNLLSGHRNGKIYCRKYRQLFHSHSPPAQEVSVGIAGSGSAVINIQSLPANNGLIVSHSMNGQLALWDLRLRKLVHIYMSSYQDWAARLPLHLTSTVSSDGSVLAAAINSEVQMWSTYTGELLTSISLSGSHSPGKPLHLSMLPFSQAEESMQVERRDSQDTVHSLCFVNDPETHGSPCSLLVGCGRNVFVLF